MVTGASGPQTPCHYCARPDPMRWAHGFALEVCEEDTRTPRLQLRAGSRCRWHQAVRPPSPLEGLALTVGALGCARRAGLTEHTVLAGPQDSTAGPLPTYHALLRSELEDHLWAGGVGGVTGRPSPPPAPSLPRGDARTRRPWPLATAVKLRAGVGHPCQGPPQEHEDGV